MATTFESVKFAGPCLMTGKDSEITIQKGTPNSGIVFISSETGEKFPAIVDRVINTTHMVVLGSPSFNIKLAEHLMAALALLNITDVEIRVKGNEIPVGDGSSKVFYDLLKESFGQTAITEKTNLTETLFYTHNHTSITALPAESFRITYAVNFPGSPFAYSWYKWEAEKDKPEDIIDARTFGYVRDLPAYQAQGFALGVTKDNTIGLNDDGTLTTELRHSNEPVRHKILDLIGDLYLSGINPLSINAHIIAVESGHFQHIQLAKMIESVL